jgi:hypothetical protein
MACKAPYPLAVAALQQNHCLLRDLYSTRMGILGELPRNASKITR